MIKGLTRAIGVERVLSALLTSWRWLARIIHEPAPPERLRH